MKYQLRLRLQNCLKTEYFEGFYDAHFAQFVKADDMDEGCSLATDRYDSAKDDESRFNEDGDAR